MVTERERTGLAADREMVTARMEVLLNQLESAKHTKKQNWAARICGGIEQLLWVRDEAGGCGGGSGDVLKRMEYLSSMVMADKPKVEGLDEKSGLSVFSDEPAAAAATDGAEEPKRS